MNAAERPKAFDKTMLEPLTIDAIEAEVMRSRMMLSREKASPEVLHAALRGAQSNLDRAVRRGWTHPEVELLAMMVAALALRLVEERRRT